MAHVNQECGLQPAKSFFGWILGRAIHPLCAKTNSKIILRLTGRDTSHHRDRVSPNDVGRKYFGNSKKEIKSIVE